jgi:hypothetical protein
MLDRPDPAELLAAIAAFLEQDVVPSLSGRTRFHALVAANAAHIIARELTDGPHSLEEEIADLWALLKNSGEPPTTLDRRTLAVELSTALCKRIGEGEADTGDWRRDVLSHLKRSIARRLAINNPKFSR